MEPEQMETTSTNFHAQTYYFSDFCRALFIFSFISPSYNMWLTSSVWATVTLGTMTDKGQPRGAAFVRITETQT